MFCEQFEARMYLLRLFGVLNGSEGVESGRPKTKSGSSRKERQEANEKAAEVLLKESIRANVNWYDAWTKTEVSRNA